MRAFEAESLDGHSVGDILNYLTSKLETTAGENCTHLLEKEWKVQAQYIQNTSACVFFLLVHIPLTKVSAAFSFLTAFTAWLIDNKTKMQVYEACQAIVNFIASPCDVIKQRKMAQTMTLDMPGNVQVSTQKLGKA